MDLKDSILPCKAVLFLSAGQKHGLNTEADHCRRNKEEKPRSEEKVMI
jgi:hypothetical protein